jgi:PIN domain nuclease of toxin-antitoxin system
VNLLLDTHVLLWWDSDNPNLGEVAKATIANPEHRVYVSAASVWEIAIKRRTGAIAYSGSPIDAIARNGFHPMPILPVHAERAADLPPLHKDPFDRMLVAQAQSAALTLITADAKVAAYPVAQLWARR